MIVGTPLYFVLYAIVLLLMVGNAFTMWRQGRFLLTLGFGVGKSMEPTVPGGVTMTIEYYPRTVEAGDVISFKYNDEFIAHRVVDVSNGGEYYYTKGDNNAHNDPRITKSDIRAKMWRPFGRVLYIPLSPYAMKWFLNRVIGYVR